MAPFAAGGRSEASGGRRDRSASCTPSPRPPGGPQTRTRQAAAAHDAKLSALRAALAESEAEAERAESRALSQGEAGRLREELTRYYRSLYPDGPAVDGLDYPEFFLALSEVGIDFLSIATYLSSRLETQFRDDPISLGGFEEDLASFRDRSVTLDELGERLESLDDRWERLSTSDRRPVTGL